MRENAFFQTDKKDLGELKPLCAVERHQHDRIPRNLFFFFISKIVSPDRHFVQKMGQRSRCCISLMRRKCIDQLLHRIPPRIAFIRIGIKSLDLLTIPNLIK